MDAPSPHLPSNISTLDRTLPPMLLYESRTNSEPGSSMSLSLRKGDQDCESSGAQKGAEPETDEVDHFIPLPPAEGVPEEKHPLTVRAVALGCLLGSLVNAADVYTGLKSGITSGAEVFGAIMGYGLLQVMTKIFASVPAVGRPFGPKENGLVQAAARGAAGSALIFTSIVPAMYKIGILSNPSGDFLKLALLVLACTSFGLFSAAPLRRFFIVDHARALNLRFPTAEATAVMIRSMNEAGHGALMAAKRFRAMIYALCACFVHKVVSSYAIGILYDWHIWTWIYIWGNYSNSAIDIENWGWIIELSPSLFGIGMLVGMNIGASIFIGSLLSWAVIGPILIHLGLCVGNPVAAGAGPQWRSYITFSSLGSGLPTEPNYVPSPYMWIIWPALAILLVSSITELLLHSSTFYRGIKAASAVAYGRIVRLFHHDGLEKQRHPEGKSHGQVSALVWGTGLILTTAVICLIVRFQWDINPGLVVLGLALSVLLSFINIYGTGVTSISTSGATQSIIMFAATAIVRAQNTPLTAAVTLIQVTSAMTTGAADVSTNLIGDFRLGFLLDTPPNAQFWAQAIGTLCSGLVAPAIFLVFANAYPCIIETMRAEAEAAVNGAGSCPFPVPSAQMSSILVPALLANGSGVLPMPTSSAWFALASAIVVIIELVASKLWLAGKLKRMQKWRPSWFGVGIGMIIPQSRLTVAIMFGATFAYIWRKHRPSGYSIYCLAVAAGMIAGEGLGGLFTAVLQVAGVGGDKYGTAVGCPAGVCM
ncbi:OPT superfamily oligopeptide transporter [Thozetella sp. PMI_491]|nr:OPT superfamily oligopeptide transporter [Thozetella sp. PMI_491]